MARKFLYFVAFCIILVIVGGIALSIWSREATEIAFVPRGEFVEQEPLAANAYRDPGMWYSRPGIGTSDPARYQPRPRRLRPSGAWTLPIRLRPPVRAAEKRRIAIRCPGS
jgi:hypothetical protein